MSADPPPPDRRPAELLALVRDPETLRRWLSGPAARHVELLPGEDLAPASPASADQHERLGLSVGRAGGRDFVRLPLDGPAGVLDRALAGLVSWLPSPHPVVIADTADGVPPDPVILQGVLDAGLVPGVDLRRSTWLTTDDAWVTGGARVARLPHHLGQPNGSSDLARLLLSLGLVNPDTPPAAWVDDVAEHRTRADATTWLEILQATYLETCLAVLRRTRPPP